MIKKLFGDKKHFYKANLHCHSTLSDGKLSPAQLKAAYQGKGYSVLAITDHEVAHNNSYLDDENFLTLTSFEISVKQFPEQSTLTNKRMKVTHLNLYAKEQDNDISVCYESIYDHYNKDRSVLHLSGNGDFHRRYVADGINEIIRIANENGCFVQYNHPRWSLENYADYSQYDGLWGVEIFNYSCLSHGIYEYDTHVLDDLLRDGKRVFASCGDDNHNEDADSFGAFTMINADHLTYGEIVDSLLSGDFYPSMGPTIWQITLENGRVRIECSPVKQISLTTAGRRSDIRMAEAGKSLANAVFEVSPDDGYFRLELVDETGKRANTQAYFL